MKRVFFAVLFVLGSSLYANVPACITSYPFITGATFREQCNHILDDESPNLVASDVQAGDVIFLARNWIDRFFTNFRPYIENKFILLTHHYVGDCDLPMPGPYAHYLEDKKLFAWFTINPDIAHPKLRPLPIGIANAFYNYGNMSPFITYIPLVYHAPRSKLLYINFNLNTNADERAYVYCLFAKKEWCTRTICNRSQEEYLLDVAQHKFILSPRGNGLDCFRTWEALLLGSIPVVKTSLLDPLFEDLPVLIIDDWEELTEEFLEKKYVELRKKSQDFLKSRESMPYFFNKLYIPYWFNEINTCKQLIERGL